MGRNKKAIEHVFYGLVKINFSKFQTLEKLLLDFKNH